MVKGKKKLNVRPNKIKILVLGEYGENAKRIQNLKEKVKEITSSVKSRNGLQLATVSIPSPRAGKPLLDEIIRSIRNADIVILDISSDKSGQKFNTNAIYELGFVHGFEFMNRLNHRRNKPFCYTLAKRKTRDSIGNSLSNLAGITWAVYDKTVQLDQIKNSLVGNIRQLYNLKNLK
jgi:hypothetical protein